MQTATRNRQPIDIYPTFVEGSVVHLKTGGPGMTVVGYCEDCGEVAVAWFNHSEEFGWDYYDDAFPSEALVLVS